MTDELISKTDVVKIVKSVLSPASSLTNVARARRQMLNEINELESKPEPHWIPVTERLPEKFDYYLVSGINSVWFARYESGRFLGILSGHALDTVIAWMPLPEPYKGVTE